jgi:hypothetical protein
MDRALRLLSKLQTRAALRRVLRGLRTPKGAVFAIVGLLVFVLWFAPVMFSAATAHRTNPEHVRLVAPLVMLVMCLVTLFGGAGDRVISFTPGEVNFLFPGPFTRRQLLLYKLSKTLGGGVFSGLILSLVLLQHASSWPAAFIASVLAMMLVQLLTLAVAMVAQSAAARAYSLGRRVALGLVVAVVLFAAAPTVLQLTREGAFSGGFFEVVSEIRCSPGVRVVLAPFEPYVQTFTAPSMPALLLWGSVSALIDLALVALILRLDTDYREAALAASQRWADRLQRARRGQLISRSGPEGRATSRWSRVPMLPWLGGAGPTIWRQLTTALRSVKAVLLIAGLMSLGFVPLLISPKAGIAPVAITAVWGTMLLTMVLKFDFRAELDQLQWLKALPLSPTATAAGQLAVPVIMVTTAQAVLLGAAAAIIPQHNQRMIALAIIPFLLPFNLLMLSVENLLFLLFPSRPAGAAPGDIGLLGRQIVFFLFKTIIVAAGCAVAVALGTIAGLVSDESLVVGGIVTLVVLLVIALVMVPCVGLAYRRFDPSADTPP